MTIGEDFIYLITVLSFVVSYLHLTKKRKH